VLQTLGILKDKLEFNKDTGNDGIGCMSVLGLVVLAGLIAGAVALSNAWSSMVGTGLEWMFLAILGLGGYMVYFTLSFPVRMLYTKFRIGRGQNYIQQRFGSLDVRIDKRHVYLGEYLKGQIVFDRLDDAPFLIKLTLVAKRFTYLGYVSGGQIPRWKHEVVWDDVVFVKSSEAVGKVVLKVPFSILVNVTASQMRGDNLNSGLSLTRLHPFELLIDIPNLPTITLYPNISTIKRTYTD
jgi:hypothetical protein